MARARSDVLVPVGRPRAPRAPQPVDRRSAARPLVVTAEHASCAVPAHLGALGLRPDVLRSHRGWDPGAAIMARIVARAFAAPLFLGRWSRLLVDLNRSATHPRVVPRSAHGEPVPGNVQLDAAGRQARIDRYWRPWRGDVEQALSACLGAHGEVVHVSVHSFVPELDGQVRDADVGLLYDPRRAGERAVVDAMRQALAGHGLRARRNYPYAGTSDGFTTHLRRQHPDGVYAGVEIEVNQRLVRDAAGARRLGAELVAALATVAGLGRVQRRR